MLPCGLGGGAILGRARRRPGHVSCVIPRRECFAVPATMFASFSWTGDRRRMRNDYEVVVIGGGAAGLSGALMLTRSRRSVLVIDAGAPRNAPAEGVHGLLG